MRSIAALVCLTALWITGCAEENKPGATPGVTVNETPDVNPQTDHDVDVTLPDVDVDVKDRNNGDIDVDVTQPRDADTKANETPGSDPDPNS